MRLSLARSTLVFVGAWNVAIFVTEGWLAERVGAPTGDPDLAIVNGRSVFRYVFADVALTVGDGQIVITPEGMGPGSQDRCNQIADRILADLPATPVSAFGINVCFDVVEPSDELAALLEPADNARLTATGLVLDATNVTRRYRTGAHAHVNLAALSASALAAIQLDFNHHFDVHPKNAGEARRVLDGQLARAVAESTRIAADIYHLQLD